MRPVWRKPYIAGVALLLAVLSESAHPASGCSEQSETPPTRPAEPTLLRIDANPKIVFELVIEQARLVPPQRLASPVPKWHKTVIRNARLR